MTREADVVRSLVEMADTLVDDYDVVDLLTGLADRCVSLLAVSAAGVMLASPSGAASAWWPPPARRCACWNCSSSRRRKGPAWTPSVAASGSGPEDLRAGAGRWPQFSAAAVRRRFPVGPSRFRCACGTRRSARSTSSAQTRSPIAEADLDRRPRFC